MNNAQYQQLTPLEKVEAINIMDDKEHTYPRSDSRSDWHYDAPRQDTFGLPLSLDK